MADGLKAALDMPYRPYATKVCIFIADAPPHGLNEGGDGFPNVCFILLFIIIMGAILICLGRDVHATLIPLMWQES